MTLLYGIHSVLEALKASSRRVERVCVDRSQKNARLQEIIDSAREHGIPISFEEKAWLDRKAEGRRHQGILCCLAEVAACGLDDILQSAARPGLLLILDGIEDPQNLGAILRSAEVAGADGVILPRWRSAGISPAVVRASAGAAAHMKIARDMNLSQAIKRLKEEGYWVAGLDAGAAKPVWEADLTVPLALVMGGEGGGLQRLVRESCDYLVSIPVRGRVTSLNVSVTAGIALYECLRQRLMPK